MALRTLTHDEHDYIVALEGTTYADDDVTFTCTPSEFALTDSALIDHLLRQGVIINDPTANIYAEDKIYDVHQYHANAGGMSGYAGEAYIQDHTWHTVNSNIELKGLVEVITPSGD